MGSLHLVPASRVSVPNSLGYADQRDQCDFVYRAFTFCGGSFQSLQLSPDLITLRQGHIPGGLLNHDPYKEFLVKTETNNCNGLSPP
jgi:hypothetical protein